MLSTIRKAVVAVAALGALALGGSAIAGAADKTTASGTSSSGTKSSQARPQREALSSGVAAKVKAAALKKVAGGTVERVETDVDHGSPYEAHVRKSDGTEVEVLVNKDFEVTAVNEMKRR